MKLLSVSFRNLRLAVSLTLGLSLGNVGWSAPSIQSIEVSPNPLTTGQNFTIAVTASPDVTQASATVYLRPGEPRLLEVSLTQQGLTWTGSGVVPADVRRQLPAQAGAMVKVILVDAIGRRVERVVQVGVEIVSISAVFANGILTVTGDNHDNTLIVGRDTAGTILVNGGVVPVTGGVPAVANTTLIQILGSSGNDVLLVDGANGPMPPAHLFGGEGDDTLTGGTSADELDGGPGDDTLHGRDGDDSLFGGLGDDNLFGDRGADGHFGGEGDDQLVWLPGDGSDLIEGQDGNDTLLFQGSNIGELVDLSANGQRLTFFRNAGNITMDCDGVERVIFQALGGADQVNVNDLTGTQVTNVLVELLSALGTGDGEKDTIMVNGTATNDLITVTGSTNGVNVLGLTAVVAVVGADQGLDELVINAFGGTDTMDASDVEAGAIDLTLNGGSGNDRLIGGSGNDLINGGQGADVMLGGAGDDTFPWFPGDASDVVEGEAGQDAMRFVGAGGDEAVDISANAQRLRFFRNPGAITMDCNETELIQFEALGGADTITVNDLAGTGVNRVNLDLASPQDSGVGDNGADTIFITGTTNDDVMTITGSTAGVTVLGLSAIVSIVGSEPTLDQLVLQMLAGTDVAEATNLQAGIIKLILGGGPGNDVLIGSAGDDTLFGDEDDDVLNGGPGLDTLDGGPGDNSVIQD